MLVVPFKTRQECGVLVLGVQPCHVNMLAKQLDRPDLVVRDDLDWLFSRASETARRPRVVPLETDLSLKDPKALSVPLALSAVDDDGDEVYSLGDIEYSWRRFAKPSRPEYDYPFYQ
jgi:hypothetical protein